MSTNITSKIRRPTPARTVNLKWRLRLTKINCFELLNAYAFLFKNISISTYSGESCERSLFAVIPPVMTCFRRAANLSLTACCSVCAKHWTDAQLSRDGQFAEAKFHALSWTQAITRPEVSMTPRLYLIFLVKQLNEKCLCTLWHLPLFSFINHSVHVSYNDKTITLNMGLFILTNSQMLYFFFAPNFLCRMRCCVLDCCAMLHLSVQNRSDAYFSEGRRRLAALRGWNRTQCKWTHWLEWNLIRTGGDAPHLVETGVTICQPPLNLIWVCHKLKTVGEDYYFQLNLLQGGTVVR